MNRDSPLRAWLIPAVLFLLASTAYAEGEMITPNYKDADIRQIIEAVSEVTGQNFIIDARVKAQVTLISSTAMTPEAFYETFLSILQVYGFVAIPSANVTKILPDTNARQLPGNDLPNQIGNTDEIVTQVIEVQNVGAAQLVPILRPLVPQYGHLAAHPASNMLIISDRASNVNRLLRIIRRIDQSGDEDIEVMRLEYATAGDMVRILTALSQSAGRSDGGASALQLVADDRTNSILISGDKAARLRFKALIAHLDTPLEEGGNTQVIYLRYADAEELSGKLKEQATQSTSGPGQAQVAGSNVVIWADTPTNALVITAPPKVMRSLRSVIDKLDIRRLQVQVEAILVDVSAEKSVELGVTWAIDSTQDTASAAITNFSGTTGVAQVGAAVLGGDAATGLGALADSNGITYGVGKISDSGTSFAAVVRALAGDANNNILSIPSIVTMDNEEAEVSVGREVPFLTGSFSNTGGTVGAVNPFQTIQRQDVGLTLKVTPQINEGDAVIMEIELEVSSLEETSGAVDLITSQRSIRQKVVVEDGGIIVLGGLIDESLLETDNRVPGLARIPFFGNLFKARTSRKVKRNLMVFISPTILRDVAQSYRETDSKYDYIRNLQQGKGRIPLMPNEDRPVMPPIDEFATPPPELDDDS